MGDGDSDLAKTRGHGVSLSCEREMHHHISVYSNEQGPLKGIPANGKPNFDPNGASANALI